MDKPSNTTDPPVTSEPTKSVDLTGRMLGDFQLIRRLGQGGMGQVYLARQISLKRQVAVKILKADLAANETSLRRFQQEAEAVARISHANIVQIYYIGQADGLHYMALEYVEGKNLRDYLSRKGAPDLPIALNIMRQVAMALQRASELGFVHRDIKPENILLTRKGEVKVADFGLSRCFAPDALPLNITQSGVTMGTPLYMSPEQVQGKPVDPRSDIYSFGVTCYHMLAGEPPFRGNTGFEVAMQHVQTEPPPLHEARPDLPLELCAVVHRMMAKRVEDRYQTAREVLRDLTMIREALGSGALTVPSVNLSAISGPRRDSTSMTVQAAPTGEVAHTRGRALYWALGVLALFVAAAAGAALRWWQTPVSASVSVTEADAQESARARFAESEKASLKRIGDTDLRLDAATNEVLDLLLMYIRDRKYKEALEFLDTIPKRGPFQDVLKAAKGADAWLRFHNAIVMDIGKGIVLAHEDKPELSSKQLLNALDEKRFLVKAKPVLPAPPADLFLAKHPRWKKELADAIQRNAVNLRGKPIDPLLERYRSYAPKFDRKPGAP